jgi:hypothetical protein
MLFVQCNKECPEFTTLIGKWNFVKEEDTTYTPDGNIRTYTYVVPGLTYQFTLSGYLFIAPSWQGKMKYALRNSYELFFTNAQKVYRDTVIISTRDSLVFKDWRTNSNGDTIKATIYLGK